MLKIGYILFYWIPPLVWMAFLFPSNDALTYANTSRFLIPLLAWLFPKAEKGTIELLHIAVRKSVHFFEYGFLSLLLLRAFRGVDKEWRMENGEWRMENGVVPLRRGSFTHLRRV